MEVIRVRLEKLQACLKEQISAETDASLSDEHARKRLDEAKAKSKAALMDILREISSTEKSCLALEDRKALDHELYMILADQETGNTLKWPLIRSLEHPYCYRAFLGLPEVMEQTRKFLTTIKAAKVEEILKECIPLDTTKESEEISAFDTCVWMEQVLSYMTGDGKRKKELDGFAMSTQSKNHIRAAINRVKSRQDQLKSSATSKIQNDSTQAIEQVAIIVDRDVRVLDQERETRRSLDLSKLVGNER